MEKFIYHSNFTFINLFKNRDENIKIIDKNCLQIANCKIITGSYVLEENCKYVVLDGFYKDSFINYSTIKILVVRNPHIKITNLGAIKKIIFLNCDSSEIKVNPPMYIKKKSSYKKKNINDLFSSMII